jgi:hypothetical protein
MTGSGHKWEPVSGIIGPSEAISFVYWGRRQGLIVMHFSRVPKLSTKDLLLRFEDMAAIRWELECPGFEAYPKDLPKCTVEKWRQWIFPLLKIEGSQLLEQHQSSQPSTKHSLSHFLLISMDDIVQIVAGSNVIVEWISPCADIRNISK